MKRLLLPIFTLLIFIGSVFDSSAQNDDEILSQIYNEALNNGKSYEMLEYLSTEIGHRLSGSQEGNRWVAERFAAAIEARR